MRIHHFIQGETIADGSNATSNVKTPTMQPDQYGAFVVTHSGAKLASNAGNRVMLQGSLDGTTWFNVETCAPSNQDYIDSSVGVGAAPGLPSWVRVVQLFPQMRAQVIDGEGRTWNAFIVE